MNRDKKQSAFRSPQPVKFLARNNSESQSFFACCSGIPNNEHEFRITRKDLSNNKKISMKNLIKKSTILPSRSQTNLNLNYSQSNLRSEWSPMTSKNHSRKPSDLSISQQNYLGEHKGLTKKSSNKINFSYMEKGPQQNNFINSYNPTNYIVDKYIVQPQEMNIIFTNRESSPSQNMEINPETGRYFDLSHQFQEDNVGKNSPKWENQNYDLKPKQNPFKGVSSKPQRTANNCHFSFGKGQKQQFLAKYYSGFRQVESRRQSDNQKQPVNRTKPLQMDTVNERLSEQGLRIPSNSLLGLVRTHINAIDSEDDESQQDSIVISSSDKLSLLRPSTHIK